MRGLVCFSCATDSSKCPTCFYREGESVWRSIIPQRAPAAGVGFPHKKGPRASRSCSACSPVCALLVSQSVAPFLCQCSQIPGLCLCLSACAPRLLGACSPAYAVASVLSLREKRFRRTSVFIFGAQAWSLSASTRKSV